VRQAFAAGVLDELVLDIAPVLLGDGEALFEDVEDPGLELVDVIHSPKATHVTYRIGGGKRYGPIDRADSAAAETAANTGGSPSAAYSMTPMPTGAARPRWAASRRPRSSCSPRSGSEGSTYESWPRPAACPAATPRS